MPLVATILGLLAIGILCLVLFASFVFKREEKRPKWGAFLGLWVHKASV